ncbi:MAG: hypothetical protein AAF497_15900 [Planctomycetota bacterium]
MNFTLQQLVLATLAVSLVSMFLSLVALWPTSRERFQSIRDATLWIAFIFILVAVMHYGLKRHDQGQLLPTSPIVNSAQPAINLNRMPRTDRLQPNRVPPRNSTVPSPSMSPQPNSSRSFNW